MKVFMVHLFITAYTLLSSCSTKNSILSEDYSFPMPDGEMTTFRQEDDLLFEIESAADKSVNNRFKKSYKIHNSENSGVFTILKLEQFDSIPLTTVPYPPARHSVIVFKRIDNQRLGYLPLTRGLTEGQLDTFKVDSLLLNRLFFYTYYSKSYLRTIAQLKKISTKEDMGKVMQLMKSDKFKELAAQYFKTETYDMYAAGFSAELFTQSCIELGYNPIVGSQTFRSLTK